MRKILLILFALILLTACNSNNSTLSISEVEVVPNDVQDAIDSESTLQLINEGEKTAYIVYHSKGEVITDLEEQGDKLKIKLNVTKEDDDVIVQRVYKLTLEDKHKALDVLINGESTPFDVVS